MDRASTFAFPGGRTLAGWHRQLTPLRPKAFWVGHWFVHHVEALADHEDQIPLDALASFLLRACRLEGSTSVKIPAIADRLGMPVFLISGWLRTLESQGMIHAQSAGEVEITSRGLDALQRGVVPKPNLKRNTFAFVERLNAEGVRLALPHYLSLSDSAALPWVNPPELGFDPHWLEDCARKPLEWKQAFRFPQEVRSFRFENGSLDDARAKDWQKVLLDRTHRIPILLVQVDAVQAGVSWLALGWRGEGWVLFDQNPVWRGNDEITEVFQEIRNPPRLEDWRSAWLQWCRQRSLAGPEAEQAVLTWSEGRILVKAPARMVQRLQANKSDLFKGEAWVLANDGYLRAAAPLVLVDVPGT